MRRFIVFVLAIFALESATAHQPATLRHGYQYPLRGNVKQLTDYSQSPIERDGVLRPKWISVRQISYYE